MAFMVCFAWWIFRPVDALHTHFVVLDLLSDSKHGTANSQYFDTVTPPGIPSLIESKRPLAHISSSRKETLKFISEDDASLTAAQIVVVYLQTTIVMAKNGDLRCLVKNSTPDLNEPEQSESLTVLKEQLAELTGKKKRVLLIIDELETFSAWRLGDFESDVSAQVLKWPAEEKFENQLIVMTSFSDGGNSAPRSIGAEGRTAFGEIVTQGLTSSAYSDDVKRLDVAEFCEHVVNETNAWERRHRHGDWQRVSVGPKPEQIRKVGHNFVLLGEMSPTLKSRERETSTAAATLERLWEKRERLDRKLAWRWRPMLWQTSTEYLLRVQKAVLEGQGSSVHALLKRADESLEKLESVTQQIVPDDADVNLEFGMPRVWFRDFPNSSQFNQWFPKKAPFANNSEATIGFALQQNLADYDFTELDVRTSAEMQEKALTVRQQSETAVSATISLTDIIPKTILSAELQCLQTEDHLFTNNVAPVVEENLAKNQSLMRSIRTFTESHQRAELMLQRTMSCSESLAHWAATFPFQNSADFHRAWGELLRKALPSHDVSAQALESLSDEANRLALNTAPGVSMASVPLRSDIFRLLIVSRRLGLLLHPIEPPMGFTERELGEQAIALADTLKLCQSAWHSVNDRFEGLCSTSNLTRIGGTPSELLSQYIGLRSTINVAGLPFETRTKLFNRLILLETQLQESDAAPAEKQSHTDVFIQDQPLWYVQHLNLFLDKHTNELSSPIFDKPVDALAATSDVSRREDLAAFGAAVRTFWRQCRNQTTSALAATGIDAPELLRHADKFSRGFSAFDADRVSVPPTAKLQTLWQVRYCLNQANLAIAGQWVLPSDSPPYAQKGWYAQVSNEWLNLAETLSRGLDSGSANIPAFVANDLAARRKARIDAGKWSVKVSPKGTGRVELRAYNQPDADLSVNLHYEYTPPTGTAAMQFIMKDASSRLTLPNNSLPLDLMSKPLTMAGIAHRNEPPGTRGCSNEEIQLSVYFRGRHFESELPFSINPCAAAEYVLKRIARPETASATVFGDDVRPLAFVLDMSGSMSTLLPSGEQRVTVALNTLEGIVKGRDARHRASLRVFGHRMKHVPNDLASNTKYEEVFGKRIVGVEPKTDIAVEVKQMALGVPGQKMFRETIEKLRQTGPFGITPLMLALKQTIAEDLLYKPGVIIAVTDGIATDVDHSVDLKSLLNKYLATKVVVVAFDLKDPSEEAKFTKTMKDCGIPANQIVNARSRDELQSRIESGLDPIQFRVSGPLFDTKADLGTTIEQIPAGRKYRAEYAEIAPYENMPAGPGDRLRIRVDWEARSFEFDRQSLAKNFTKANRPEDPQIPWILRMVEADSYQSAEAGSTQSSRLELTLLLDHTEKFHPVRQPAEIEFRFTSDQDYRTPEIHEQYFPDLGAPGYKFNIRQWPIDQNISVDAVWKMERTTPENVTPFGELKKQSMLGTSGQLPACRLSSTLSENGVLEIRLEPIPPTTDTVSTSAVKNAVEDIRIEVGSWGELKTFESFRPDEVTTTVHRTEDGAVIFRFDGEYTSDKLAAKEIAFTSRAGRSDNAIQLPTMLIRPRDRKTEK